MLVIENISKTYGNGVRALDDLSLSIGKGMFGLLGPNGAGKSTLMRTIATLQTPDQGKIHFQDRDILTDKDFLRRNLGYLPQEFGVYPESKANELLHHLAVMKGMTNSKERSKHIEELLELTNLLPHQHKKLGGYSGGMKQRFGIAQALLLNPSLLIVDEPTAGLDPEERDRFLNLLGQIGQETTIILSTHIVNDISELCPKFAIINKGKLLLNDSPQKAIATLEGKIWQKIIEPQQTREDFASFEVLSTRFAFGNTLLRLYATDSPGHGFEAVRPTLEDVYFYTIKSRDQQQ